MVKIKLVILDYDLTLIDTFIDFYDAINRACMILGGKPLDYDEFVEMFNNDSLSYKAPPSNTDPVRFWKLFRKIYETKYGIPVKGAHRFLSWIKMYGIKVVVMTGREVHPDKIWFELARFDLDWGIDEVYTMYSLKLLGGSEEYLFDKSWMIKLLLEKYSVEPHKALMLGDYWLDAESSSRAGIKFIGVSAKGLRKQKLLEKGALTVVDDLEEALYSIYKLFGPLSM